MRVIDPATGLPPILRNGDTFTFEVTTIDDIEIPDALGPDGEEVRLCRVIRKGELDR